MDLLDNESQDTATIGLDVLGSLPRRARGREVSAHLGQRLLQLADRPGITLSLMVHWFLPLAPRWVNAQICGDVERAAGIRGRRAPLYPRTHQLLPRNSEQISWLGRIAQSLARVYDTASGGSMTIWRGSIVRVGLDGSSSAPLLANAMMPAASPDGRTLAYVTSDEHGTPRRLWLAGVDGRGAQDLLGNQGFSFIRSPRFAPDGSRLTFAAVGGPATASPTSDRPTRRLARLLAAVAEAHGVPWEIWTVRPDGRELRRLTHLQEDSPVPTWSPDGQWIDPWDGPSLSGAPGDRRR